MATVLRNKAFIYDVFEGTTVSPGPDTGLRLSDDATVNLYDRLFTTANPGAMADFHQALNPDSNIVMDQAKFEPAIELVNNPLAYQFERLGYFISDYTSTTANPVFNRTMTLRDSWAKIEQSR